MRKTSYLLLFIMLASCTSNTIFKEPKDLIPKDTMSLLLQEMIISTSAKFIKNKKNQKNINYMPFVYEKFKIDSTRFESSNYYYMSTIDLYQEILENAKASIENRQDVFKKIKANLDSIKKDAKEIALNKVKKGDSLMIAKKLKKMQLSKKKLGRYKYKRIILLLFKITAHRFYNC